MGCLLPRNFFSKSRISFAEAPFSLYLKSTVLLFLFLIHCETGWWASLSAIAVFAETTDRTKPKAIFSVSMSWKIKRNNKKNLWKIPVGKTLENCVKICFQITPNYITNRLQIFFREEQLVVFLTPAVLSHRISSVVGNISNIRHKSVSIITWLL